MLASPVGYHDKEKLALGDQVRESFDDCNVPVHGLCCYRASNPCEDDS